MLLTGGLFSSCQYESLDQVTVESGNFRLEVSVDGIGTGILLDSRATVPSVTGEDNVGNLHLLFFEYSTDGSGLFVKDYIVAAPAVGSPFELKIGTGAGQGLSHTGNYSILAFANMDSYMDVTSFVAGLADADENTAKEKLIGLPASISASSLPMSGQTVKRANQELVELALTRAVIRLDIQNTLDTYYDLVSASIYSAASQSVIWGNDNIPDLIHTGKFYGIGDGSTSLGDVSGGLYAFQNFEGNPINNVSETTALVVGLKVKAGAPVGTEGSLHYYRINIHPQDGGQNLKRNNVYKVSLRGVTGAGESSESDAAANTENPLEVTINNWDLDEEGMVLTDGQNTLAIPSKYIKFGPEAEVREYSVYTIGTGTLEIKATDLPNGLQVSLSGNTLRVTAEALSTDEERSGTFDLGFAGLLGTVEVIQTPRDDNFLTLNRGTLPIHVANGRGGITDGELITVSSSGDWWAKIYNTSSDEDNPGFSFSATDTLSALNGVAGDSFDIFTTGGNPSNDIRRGFVVISLKADSKYKQVVVLSQEPKSEIVVTPYTTLPFDAAGMTTSAQTPAETDYYEISVSPGMTSTGLQKAWEAELTGTDADLFEYVRIEGDNPKVIVGAKGTNGAYPGMNLGDVVLDASLKISLSGTSNPQEGTDYVLLPITQEKLNFTVTRLSTSLEKVPVTGTEVNGAYTAYVEYQVNIPESLDWDASITAYSHDAGNDVPAWKVHKGYLVDGNNQKLTVTSLSSQSSDHTIRVGFDKIYFPLAHWSDDPASNDYNLPEVTVTVSISGLPGLGTQTVTPQQDPLVARDIRINDMYGRTADQWGMLNGVTTYFSDYRTAMYNSSSYGPNGTVKTTNYFVLGNLLAVNAYNFATGGSIAENVNYVHAAAAVPLYNDAAFTAMETWRKNTDGILFYVNDPQAQNYPQPFTNTNSTLYQLGIDYMTNSSSSSPHISTLQQDTRVMKYLLNGPFGEVKNVLTHTFTLDAVHSSIKRSSLPEGMVVAIHEENSEENVLLAIDPESRVIYLGDSQMLGTYADGSMTTEDNDSYKRRFRANFIAYVLNTAQFGSHFTEVFTDETIAFPY